MQIQTVTAGAQNEVIFRVARNAYTKTATITAASLSRGGPAILATASASVNGYDVVNPDTQAQLPNNLLVGVVWDYPDTSVARNGVWQPEDVGLVQCYGLHTNVFFQQTTKTDTFAAGILLSPDTGSAFKTSLSPIYATGTVASSAIFTGLSGVAGLVVLAQSLASAASETRVGVSAFIRCM
jgi:hypothetical protein